MKLNYYHVDAFADNIFEGNPAAVYVLEEWLDDGVLQAIAAEHNLAETAFCVIEGSGYRLRWFTPEVEVDLCGHATLATAYVLFNQLNLNLSSITFESRSGPLRVTKIGELIEMDFPAEVAIPCEPPSALTKALGLPISRCFFNVDYVVVLESEQQVLALKPDFVAMAEVDARGVIVTAVSEQFDFVNRFFAPEVGINEDPVTGSAFTKLIPFWSKELGKQEMQAKQVSARGGKVKCTYAGDRVIIAGKAALFAKGEISI